ncbi:hypothetical protein M0R45_022731 [Rubus argutus]|uniref:Uncharacterized protein n=1 Tax=Rubus argutus TaxID=59490 RepID=A0AAW1XG47_RUBAR
MAASCNSSLPGPPPPPPRAVETAIHGGASATSLMAPRWIPKRGQVLRRALKTVFSCVCIRKESKYPHRSSSVVSFNY